MRLDQFVTDPPTCIFCGTSSGTFTVEDVWPYWFRKVVRAMPESQQSPPRFFKKEGNDLEAETKAGQALTLELRDAICRDCNGGWMSVLENNVSQTLKTRMLSDDPLRLQENQQRDLAFWAVEKALLTPLALCQEGLRPYVSYLTSNHLQWMYAHRGRTDRQIPPGTRVSMFRHAPAAGPSKLGTRSETFLRMRGFDTANMALLPEDAPENAKVPCAAIVTMAALKIGFQVFISDFEAETAVREVPPIPPRLNWGLLTHITPKTSEVVTLAPSPIVEGITGFGRLSFWDGQPVPGFRPLPRENRD